MAFYKWNKKSKYNAIPTEVDGFRFDSKMEARRYEQLKSLIKSGEVKHVDIHPIFWLAPGIKYEADFGVYYSNGSIEIEDVKGYETSEFKIKAKLFNQIHPLAPLKIIKGRTVKWKEKKI